MSGVEVSQLDQAAQIPLTVETNEDRLGRICHEAIKRIYAHNSQLETSNMPVMVTLGWRMRRVRKCFQQFYRGAKTPLQFAKSLGFRVQRIGELTLQQAEDIFYALNAQPQIAKELANEMQDEQAHESRLAIRVFVRLERDLRSFPPPLEYRPTIQPNAPALI